MLKMNVNKMALVRDFIPNLMKEQNCNCDYTIVTNDNEYIELLKQKLQEETQEVFVATNKDSLVEELADCLEVIQCIAATQNVSMADLINIQARKRLEKGSFKNRIFLKTYEKINKS